MCEKHASLSQLELLPLLIAVCDTQGTSSAGTRTAQGPPYSQFSNRTCTRRVLAASPATASQNGHSNAKPMFLFGQLQRTV